jgi:bifunctional non-homologous end joining protein LigD
VPRTSLFIPPCEPILRPRPPRGEAWLHEVKFDGFRTQLHKAGDEITIYSRNGADFTSRYPAIVSALTALPVRSAIIDAEMTVCSGDGVPQFYRLLTRRFDQGELCAWAFDVLSVEGDDLREKPLQARKAALVKLLRRASLPAGLGELQRSRQATGGMRAARARGCRVEAG